MKPIKFDLPINGKKVRNLGELRENFTSEIVKLHASGVLQRWLQSRDLMAEATKLSMIRSDNDVDKLLHLCEVFGVPADRRVIETEMDFSNAVSRGTAFVVTTEETELMAELRHTARMFELIENGIRELNGLPKRAADESPTAREITTFVNTEMIVESCESAAWFRCLQGRLLHQNCGDIHVYRAYALIWEPFVSNRDETDTLRELSESETFVELREKLESFKGQATDKLWNAVNIKMTNLINRVLKNNLLVNASINSFVTDILGLIESLGNDYGPSVQECFLMHQESAIKSAFIFLKDADAKSFTESWLEGRNIRLEDGSEPKVTYFGSNYSLSYLDCWGPKNDADLTPDTAAAVRAITPIMRQVLKKLFDDIAVSGQPFERHVLTTNGNMTFEASKGFLGNDVFLLSVVEEC